MAEVLWQRSRGEDLVELFREGSLDDDLPKCQAVYLWKWNLRPSPAHHLSAKPFARWLSALIASPNGRASNVRLSHFLHLSQLELRGGRLSDTKVRALEQFLASPGNRGWMKRFLNELAPLSVGLYVGETMNLSARVRQHLEGDTDFGILVSEHPLLAWENLDLHFCDLGPQSSESTEIRKTIEYITAVLTVAGFTQRPG